MKLKDLLDEGILSKEVENQLIEKLTPEEIGKELNSNAGLEVAKLIRKIHILELQFETLSTKKANIETELENIEQRCGVLAEAIKYQLKPTKKAKTEEQTPKTSKGFLDQVKNLILER